MKKTEDNNGCAKKGCLFLILGIVLSITISFVFNWDKIEEDTANAKENAQDNIAIIEDRMDSIYTLLYNFEVEDTVLQIPRTINIDNEDVLYCTLADIALLSQAKDTAYTERHLIYNDIDQILKIKKDSIYFNAFEAEDLAEEVLSKRYWFVVRTFLFLKPHLLEEDAFESGYTFGRTYVIDSKEKEILGYAPFEATNSSSVYIEGGVQLSIKKIIPIGTIGDNDEEETIMADFYDNIDSVVDSTWLLMYN